MLIKILVGVPLFDKARHAGNSLQGISTVYRGIFVISVDGLTQKMVIQQIRYVPVHQTTETAK